MKSKVYSLILFACLGLSTFAQKKTINQNWEFQRLKQIEQKGEIKNQGTDWSSQYNVEHVSVVNEQLRVSEDTLNAEFQALEGGGGQT